MDVYVYRTSLKITLFLLMALYVVTYAKHRYYAGVVHLNVDGSKGRVDNVTAEGGDYKKKYGVLLVQPPSNTPSNQGKKNFETLTLVWKSYYVQANTKNQVKTLNAIRDKLDLDFLSPAYVGREAVVLVAPEQHEEFIKKMNNLGIKYRIHFDDVKSALDHDDQVNDKRTKSSRVGSGLLTYKNYERLETIYAYLKYIEDTYPNFTIINTHGNTSEGRPIRYLRISTTRFKDKNKPIIIIEAGMHGREWIAPPIVTWAIRKLTEAVTEPDLLKHYDWILIPVANPDGYVHTFSGKRFWRKNRSTKSPNNHFCPGVDLNRNFDIAWNTVGTEKDSCSLNFPGSKAFSEKETQVLRDVLKRRHSRVALYLSMHSYGSMILYPWAYTQTRSHYRDTMFSVGIAMADEIFNINRPIYPGLLVGTSSRVLYEFSGTSMDYVHNLGITLAYTFELPGITEGPVDTALEYNGFHMDPQYIEEVCRATWSGIIVGARIARHQFLLERHITPKHKKSTQTPTTTHTITQAE